MHQPDEEIEWMTAYYGMTVDRSKSSSDSDPRRRMMIEYESGKPSLFPGV